LIDAAVRLLPMMILIYARSEIMALVEMHGL
jgi:hypothetical protein